MGSIPDPGELTELTQPSFDEFQRQTSLMTSCTLLWKELSDHFTSLEQNLQKKSEALKQKIQTLDTQTKASLANLRKREVTIDGSVEIALERLDEHKEAALKSLENPDSCDDHPDGEVDNGEGLLQILKSLCLKMESMEFWQLITRKKKEIEVLRSQIPLALSECVDPCRFVLEAISEVFPVDKRCEKSGNDLGWACVLSLESLIPVVVDPVIGKCRVLVTPSVKERAKEIAETWKRSLEERGGIENVKTPDVHTFLQHLVTFGIVKKEDVDLYRKLVVASAWRKQMPKLALSLGLGDKMPDMIEELISRGQQLDAVHFTYEVGLVDKFPPVPLLKAFLKDAKKAAASILEDPDNTGRAAHLAARKEQSALRAVIKCIEEYKLEAEFPPENLKKRLEQLEKTKTEKKRPAAVPANKRTRASNGGPMPPAKAGRLTNAYVSSFPAPPAFVRSPSHTQYPTALPAYPSPPAVYGTRSPPSPYAYSPEAAPPIAGSYPGAPLSYPAYGGYGNGFAPAYQQAYYR
ncbi:Protein FRIGIDA, putative [Ricinus communis]|uniref:FRIGIDA-like protein n=1 Tax=Ricinus communis TaxID=3988 RepID=B9RTR7_RICCO|nr:Protein FRIGIDA, putative [Ricinus communis]|eukprot:XP_002517136.1 FRIGIDA-like protein 4a [Ricinus communis]